MAEGCIAIVLLVAGYGCLRSAVHEHVRHKPELEGQVYVVA